MEIIESLAGGLAVERNPEVDAVFAARPETAGMTARALVRDGRYVAIVGLQEFEKILNQQETTEFLAGAEESGREQGEATRTELRGQPAVVAFLPDRKVWTFVAGRYVGIVAGAEEGLVDDVAIQLVRRVAR